MFMFASIAAELARWAVEQQTTCLVELGLLPPQRCAEVRALYDLSGVPELRPADPGLGNHGGALMAAEEPANAQETDIVKRLRYWEGEYHYPAGLLTEAANVIEIYETALRKIAESTILHGNMAGAMSASTAQIALDTAQREYPFGPRHPR